MHEQKIDLYLNDDELERLSVLERYLVARSKDFFPFVDVSSGIPFVSILRLGIFDGVVDLSCLKDPAEIEKMKEYLARTNG